jgi:CheY-like chemotaxis protein
MVRATKQPTCRPDSRTVDYAVRSTTRGNNGARGKTPRKQTIARAAPRRYRERMNSSNAGSQVSQRVLIVEDDEDSREMLGELVSSYGHQPVQAANAAEALERARDQKPDLALIDLGLPQLGGCELARLLRRAMADAPGIKTRLVALTGYSDREMRESADAAGFDAYVVKPIMPEALEKLLRA